MDYSPWSSKNLIDRNWLKKFRQIGVDVTHMHTNFGGRDLSSFGDTATLKKRPNFPFDPWTIVHGHQKFNRSELAQKIHASRCWCNIHAHQIWWAWPLRFRNFGSFLLAFKFPMIIMIYSMIMYASLFTLEICFICLHNKWCWLA